MKKIVEIIDPEIISDMLADIEFGTLALCCDNKPYSVPLNFVEIKGEVFFHGAKKGKKIDILKENSYASFSVVESYSLLPSYFSTDDGKACPATHMFKSIIIDGKIEFVENYDEKSNALEGLMQKLQKEGKYIPLNNEMYKKAINAVCVYKLIPSQTKAKFNLGQNFNEERYQRVSKHLKQRGSIKDFETLKLIEEYRK